MRLLLLALFAGAALAAPFTPSLAPLVVGTETVEGEYIVRLKASVGAEAHAQHLEEVAGVLAQHNGTLMHNYENLAPSFRGYAVRLGDDGIAVLRASADVEYVEANQVVRAVGNVKCETQEGATWGLVRTAEKSLKITGAYTYSDVAGEEVDAYVIDTGIYLEHNDFQGRAEWGTDTVDTPSPKTDSNGHGTHVAGTIMSKTWGLAKRANAIAVKVLGASGSGTTAGVIAGVDWVAEHHAKKRNGKKSVANMSLGGGYSKSMNDAADACVDAGVVMAVASGNSNTDACSFSPASAKKVITVNSSDNQDKRSYFSNYGSCTDIFAPGSDITSTWIGGKDSDNTISGTSMASPHVAGIAVKYFTSHPSASTSSVKDSVIAAATDGTITDVQGSPNKLVYGPCE